MDRKLIHSVGIDIGTTTTQVIFSNLTVVNRAPASQVPVYEFIEREIVYQSPVSFTPINREGTIDATRLQQFIEQQIEQAGLAENVETGAIIITGETAKAHNARDAIMALSQQLGDFVVATAGPNLESVIAGRGSGAQELAQNNHLKVMNIDIGGGTSNYVVFDCGRVVETACLNIGGRLVELNDSGDVVYVHKPGIVVMQDLFGEALHPRQITADHLKRMVDRMADLIVEVMEGQLSPLAVQLLQTSALSEHKDLDAVFLSGGVGECYYQHDNQEAGGFGDIGPRLALSLLRHGRLSKYPVRRPNQTLRATVIGAGAYSLTLSGSTIWLNSDELPLKNIPVVHPAVDWLQPQPSICDEIVIAAERMDLALGCDRYAIALDRGMPVRYQTVQHVAEELARFYQHHGNHQDPAFVIVHNDIGKAVGMELQPKLQPQPVSVIDEVITHEGDYIDIGNSYFGGEIVPLTVKSLAFPS